MAAISPGFRGTRSSTFHVDYPLRSGKSKYRGKIKLQAWATCRCLWVNLVRIIHFIEQTYQRTFQKSKNTALALKLWFENTFPISNFNKLAALSSIFCFVIFYGTFNHYFKTLHFLKPYISEYGHKLSSKTIHIKIMVFGGNW